jgi:hypothetical protein
MYLLTELGRAGREMIWLEVMAVRTERSETKYFPVRPDLTQSISILSYDYMTHILARF